MAHIHDPNEASYKLERSFSYVNSQIFQTIIYRWVIQVLENVTGNFQVIDKKHFITEFLVSSKSLVQ